MGDIGEFWRDVKAGRGADRRERVAYNKRCSTSMLEGKGIAFEEKNFGEHLVVTHGEQTVDFWPGTGKWIRRGDNKTGRGVFGLLALLDVAAKKGKAQ